MRFNKKGFTLVELLAVVVILGIIMTVSIPMVSRWINRSKGESMEAQKQTLLLAGQSYAQNNSKVLPKSIGETKLIKAVDLKKANYLKDNLTDSEKKDCMEKSFVRVYKYDKNGYSYSAFLYCGEDEVPETITGVEPSISIAFKGENLTDEVLQDVSNSGFVVTIEGGKKDGKNLGIDGYTYSVSVKYAGTGEIVEIFNSGSLNGGGREKLVIEKSLGDYTNVTTLSEFMITVEAYNRDGGYKKVTGNSKYGDNTPPVCGDIEGQAGENEWFKTPHTSTISVKCKDEANGSGCTKEVFTKSWNTEAENGNITIKDNAGNTTECEVRVHHDWTYPNLVVTAFVRNSDGSKGTQVGSITANNSSRTQTFSNYTNSYGTNHWLNLANFPNGIVYEVTVSDNIHAYHGQWYYNNSGISEFNASNLNSMNTGSSKTFSPSDSQTSVSLSAEGIRRARYELTDKAGNKVVVNIEANIDRTNPGCVSSGGSSSWTNNKRTLTGTCSDSMSKCQGNITKDFTEQQNSSTRSPGTVYDNAGNSYKCPGNQTVKIDKTPPTCSYKKLTINSPDGITAELICNDDFSGLSTCPCKYHDSLNANIRDSCLAGAGLKKTTSYTVKDIAGNTGSCSIPVEEYQASDYRTRTCRTFNTCQTASCGTNCCHDPYRCCTTICRKTCSSNLVDVPCHNDPACPGHWSYYNSESCSTCYTDYCNCTCAHRDCGCAAYNPWLGWREMWADVPCTNTDIKDCRFRKQYR